MSGASGLRKHDHSSAGQGGSLGAASPTSLVIPGATSPAQTAEGSAVWDSDDDKLTVGTGAGRKTLVNEGGSLSLLGAPTADFSVGSHKLTNVTDPGSPQDAATKAYVDSEVAGAGGLSDTGVFTYLDATVGSAPSAPSAGYLRFYAKTGAHLAQKDSSNVETLLDSSGGCGGLLAVGYDTAGSNVQTTSTTVSDIDATNLIVTFTAPASGNVIIVMSGTVQLESATSGKFYYWGLREGGSTLFTRVIADSDGVTHYRYFAVRFYITGLTPSSSYTYKGAHKTSSGGSFTSVGGSSDPRMLEVLSAP